MEAPNFNRQALTLSGFIAGSVLLSVAVAIPQSSPFQNPTPAQAAFFESRIRPILVNSCQSCHGKTAQVAGLRLDTRDGLMKGGESGPVVIPGDADKSLLIQAVRQTGGLKMPQGGKLKPEEIADLEAWVKMGAPWPVDSMKRNDALWSLQPVRKPQPPKVKNAAWIKNSIDNFVLAQIEAKKLRPSPPADRYTLLRRVTYDLTGLPPTPSEMSNFLADKSPNAYERVVDRLLSSPRYGERWARHWLDVARYADTKGYVFEEDRTYPNAYTYRDWVIRAFNEDLPYDQFIVQQLAADRLPEVQNSDDKRPLAALGFLNVGRRFLNQQPDIIDDRIDVTMRGFEGFTVGCARCHDHKFDPIPTQDYYSLYSVFASSQEELEPISEKSVRDPWLQYSQRVSESERTIHDLVIAQMKRLRVIMQSPEQQKSLPEDVRQVLQNLRVEAIPDGPNLATLAKAFESNERDRLARIQQDLATMKASAPRTPEFAMAMADRPNPADGRIFKRGNPGNPGDPAPRRFLLALSKPGEERAHWTTDSGRLELAEAIASKDNPLTARVFVNRLWQHHFGAGIVRTASDFGHQGEKPTDPQLLDYLASTFMDSGWSIKKLQRLIVTSATYRQSSEVSAATVDIDPENRTWCRMNRTRLDLEEVRDSILRAAGKLDTSQVGGKSVDLWSTPFTDRRAVYGFIERQNLPGTFRTFDFASPDSTSPSRFQTTVPQQALFFMNSTFAVEQARALVDRAEVKEAKDNAEKVRRLYLLLFQRAPRPDELSIGLAYLKKAGIAPALQLWQYGFGGLDPTHQRVASFIPLAHFGEGVYRVGTAFPDPKLGYIQLSAEGGHPGHDGDHAVIRRWTAPSDMSIKIEGMLGHPRPEGDGVRARIVSSRSGLLGEWQAHHASTPTKIPSVTVRKGDTIDFIVDPIESDAFDAFNWAPKIISLDGTKTWEATTGFAPPPPASPDRLTLYAQALMMTNEFMFVD